MKRLKNIVLVIGIAVLSFSNIQAKEVTIEMNGKVVKVNEEKGMIAFSQLMSQLGYEKTDDVETRIDNRLIAFEKGLIRVGVREGADGVEVCTNKLSPRGNSLLFQDSGQPVFEMNGDLYVPKNFITFFSKHYSIDGVKSNPLIDEASKVGFTLSTDDISKLVDGVDAPKMTDQQIKALVGKSPEVLQKSINTLYDLLKYIEFANFEESRGDIKHTKGDIVYSYNSSANDVIKNNKGNCGGRSNVLNYLLGDNYETGYYHVMYGKGDGGHVFNYIKKDGYYYVLDLTLFDPTRDVHYLLLVDVVSDLGLLEERLTKTLNDSTTTESKVEAIWTYKNYKEIVMGQNKSDKLYLPEQHKLDITVMKDINNRINFTKFDDDVLKLGD